MKRLYLLTFMAVFLLAGCSGSGSSPKGGKPDQPPPGSPKDFTREERLKYSETLVALFDDFYAPLSWKEDLNSLAYDDISESLLGKARRTVIQEEDFLSSLFSFIASFDDAHVSLAILSPKSAELPVSFEAIGDDIVVREVDRSILSESEFPFYPGDLLKSFDGMTTEKLLEELGRYETFGYEPAQRRWLARRISSRAGAYQPEVPEGVAKLKIHSWMRDDDEDVSLSWLTWGNEEESLTHPSTPIKNFKSAPIEKNPLDILRQGVPSWIRGQAEDFETFEPFFSVWNNFKSRYSSEESVYYSGTFMLEGKTIGFLRIPSWMPADPSEDLDFLSKEIAFYEKNTDALIIDQTNNLGGNICFGELFAGFFINEPIQSVIFQIRTSDIWTQQLEMMVEYSCEEEGSNDCIVAKNFLSAIDEAAARGDELTNPMPLCAYDGTIYPFVDANHKTITYTKPVMMLNNEISMSTADMVPAILQDAGRVTMFGSRTMGAGGSVQGVSIGDDEDWFITITQALAVRPNEIETQDGIRTRYLENIGVEPDIQYLITLDDFFSDYVLYRNAVDQSILSLLDQE
ncbi:MAG: hypothetical protein HN337_08600 [Deltaproteobacteria bacterium]|jgi:hypothetical protein|nr:hypothetical protein [Deltaproteobacteria bacterium]